jgi:hypothetical protein
MCDKYIDLKDGKCEFLLYDSVNKKCHCANMNLKKKQTCDRSDQKGICEKLWDDSRLSDES